MKKQEMEVYRQRLLDLGRRVQGDTRDTAADALRHSGGAASGNLSNTPMHLGDLSADTYEQEVSLSLLENEQQRLQNITDALERIDQGTYGRCEECGKEISRGRLDAEPAARWCIDCARRLQSKGYDMP